MGPRILCEYCVSYRRRDHDNSYLDAMPLNFYLEYFRCICDERENACRIELEHGTLGQLPLSELQGWICPNFVHEECESNVHELTKRPPQRHTCQTCDGVGSCFYEFCSCPECGGPGYL